MTVEMNSYIPQQTIVFDRQIRFHPELSFGEKVFLAEIQAMTSTGDTLYFSSRSMAKLFNVSHQTILNWVDHLVKHNFIKVKYDCHEKRFFLKSKNVCIK